MNAEQARKISNVLRNLKYKADGYGERGCYNCWGLVRAVLGILGIKCPELAVSAAAACRPNGQRAVLDLVSNSTVLVESSPYCPGDIVLSYTVLAEDFSAMTHVGVFLDAHTVLECSTTGFHTYTVDAKWKGTVRRLTQ